jgi:hypothetical protein
MASRVATATATAIDDDKLHNVLSAMLSTLQGLLSKRKIVANPDGTIEYKNYTSLDVDELNTVFSAVLIKLANKATINFSKFSDNITTMETLGLPLRRRLIALSGVQFNRFKAAFPAFCELVCHSDQMIAKVIIGNMSVLTEPIVGRWLDANVR